MGCPPQPMPMRPFCQRVNCPQPIHRFLILQPIRYLFCNHLQSCRASHAWPSWVRLRVTIQGHLVGDTNRQRKGFQGQAVPPSPASSCFTPHTVSGQADTQAGSRRHSGQGSPGPPSRPQQHLVVTLQRSPAEFSTGGDQSPAQPPPPPPPPVWLGGQSQLPTSDSSSDRAAGQ